MTIAASNRLQRLAAPSSIWALAGLLVLSGAHAVEPSGPGAVGSEFPAIRLELAGGGAVESHTLRGKVVLYEFWATWCTPCHVQVEVLKGLYPRVAPAGVEFVAVATGEPPEIVHQHLAEHPYPYPVALDPDEKLGTALQVLGLPTLVVVDRAGMIVWRQTGLVSAETLERALHAAGAAPQPAG